MALVKCEWLGEPRLSGVPGPAELEVGVTEQTLWVPGSVCWLTEEQADDPNTPAKRMGGKSTKASGSDD